MTQTGQVVVAITDDESLMVDFPLYNESEEILVARQGCAVHLMGETSYVCELSSLLGYWHIPVLCSTTRREVVEHAEGRKESVFRFVRMRQIA